MITFPPTMDNTRVFRTAFRYSLTFAWPTYPAFKTPTTL